MRYCGHRKYSGFKALILCTSLYMAVEFNVHITHADLFFYQSSNRKSLNKCVDSAATFGWFRLAFND